MAHLRDSNDTLLLKALLIRLHRQAIAVPRAVQANVLRVGAPITTTSLVETRVADSETKTLTVVSTKQNIRQPLGLAELEVDQLMYQVVPRDLFLQLYQVPHGPILSSKLIPGNSSVKLSQLPWGMESSIEALTASLYDQLTQLVDSAMDTFKKAAARTVASTIHEYQRQTDRRLGATEGELANLKRSIAAFEGEQERHRQAIDSINRTLAIAE
ncbi:unnamed protein product, partial [Prorocentrum cordatum]